MSDLVNKILSEEQVVKAASKLSLKKLEVNINPKQFLVDFYKSEIEKITKLDKTGATPKDLELFELTKKTHEEQLAKAEACKLEAYLVPLKHTDMLIIKSGILEALKCSAEFNFDDDIRMKNMITAEHTFTVYLTLRNKQDVAQRYYRSLEEITKEPDSTIDALYNLYLENFVLTEEERKNF